MINLFIYIPTYNRPEALKKQLKVLLPQVDKYKDFVRVTVQNNGSQNEEIKQIIAYCSEFENVVFNQNLGNIGANANISLGFVFARENEFLWILSDNDLVTDTSISYILESLSEDIDFAVFNYGVTRLEKVEWAWANGWQEPMDWRMGLISDTLFNTNSIKSSIDDAFYYHNSSFPHLAVACSAAKKKGITAFLHLPRSHIHEEILSSEECPTDYSLAHVGMPHLLPLFPKEAARKFALLWAKRHSADLYLNRKKHPSVFAATRKLLVNYGGLYIYIYFIKGRFFSKLTPFSKLKKKVREFLISKAENHLSERNIQHLKRIKRKVWPE